MYLGDDGQIAIGDSTNYLKYYKDQNGDFILEISAKNIFLSSSGENIEEAIDDVITQISTLDVRAEGIEASVESIKTENEATSESIEGIKTEIGTLTNSVNAKMSETDVEIKIQTEIAKGTNKVVTNTGFVFDDTGLTISKTGREMKTNIDEDGVSIYKNEDEVLTVDSDGVIAYDLQARTHLIIGTSSQFKDFEKDGKIRTGCFWIGEVEVDS